MLIGVRKKVKGAKIFFIGEIFLSLVFVMIYQTPWVYKVIYPPSDLGFIVSSFSIMVVAVNNYTNIYLKNKKLVHSFQELNESLELKVKEKTTN